MSSGYNERCRGLLRSKNAEANAATQLYSWGATLQRKKAKGVPIVTEGPVKTKHISDSLDLAHILLQQRAEQARARQAKHGSVAPLPRPEPPRTISTRLAARFGFGQKKKQRQEFYAKIEAIAEQHGETALRIISDCVYAAEKKDHPGKWFCAAVVRRLKENGFEFERNTNDW